MDVSSAPIDALQEEMGRALDEAIDRQGGKVAFAKRAGLNRAMFYRMLRGENVSTEVLLRTLRALGRADLVAALLTPPEPTPLERLQRSEGSRSRSSRKPVRNFARGQGSLVGRLKVGRRGRDSDG